MTLSPIELRLRPANNLECPLCKKSNSLDSEAHSLVCDKVTNLLPESADIKLDNLYSEDITFMKETIQILVKIMDIRSDMIIL